MCPTQKKPTAKSSYAAAGVNIDVASQAKELIAGIAETTYRPEVLSGVGFYGGMFELKGYKNPVLVSSTDGVGTKLKIAIALNKHDTVGMDIVNHSVNDIFTCGAEPLFFLDYVAFAKLVPEQAAEIVRGMAQACREVNCALIGGETAQMPGLYHGEDYDIAGFIIGVVEKDRIIKGQNIKVGDVCLGIPSSGLHTNGYSLARRIFGETKAELSQYYPELGRTVGEALLEPHRCYFKLLKPLLPQLRGLAHITGGGLPDNVPRILPDGVSALFRRKLWEVPPLFQLIQKKGKVDPMEMFRVFNMGIGMVAICAPENVKKITKALPEAMIIGEIVPQQGENYVVIE
ncbi:MAG: phosphoribosylformylglycinamidine cyclo-ligase [Dehalococcoidales bacterium]|nr:phosphoribosylformylglycinamidine cyclo-ligase [Dehalococcoidales bacterium]